MLWSILIAGIPERYHTVQPLLLSLLEHQSLARIPDTEVLYLMDNRRRPVGAKRNVLLDAARGEYISFIDDDDEVASDYVDRIRNSIIRTRKEAEPADVICFRQRALIAPQGITHECHYSLEFAKREQKRQLEATEHPGIFKWTGPPAHTLVWRRETIAGIRFPETQFGEDVDWVDAACAKAQREVQLDAELYTYKFDEDKTATR
jgi:glycosyltransferase involved in cell wall biosynthesis